MLSRLEIGLERNSPETNLTPELWIVSIIFKFESFALMKRKDPYSNSDSIKDLYIILSEDEFAPQEVWANILRMFILVIVVFLSSFRWTYQLFLVSNTIPKIFIILVLCIGALFILMSIVWYFFLDGENDALGFWGRETITRFNRPFASDESEYCNTGCIFWVFFPQYHMFKSSAKSVYFTGNLISSQRSLISTKNSETDKVESCGTPFSCLNTWER